MFRKIDSNRSPGDTVFSELKKQFGSHFNNAVVTVNVFMKRHPKPVFALMIGCMAFSMVFSFTVFRNKEDIKPGPVITGTAPVRDGLGAIMRQGSVLRRSMLLKDQIENLITKDSLSHADSLQLSRSIHELQEISIYLNPKP